MLVAHNMGSHSGQQNFPFGYIPNEVHGIGLPEFMTPGPPAGQPLLSEHDTQNLDSFLSGFDTTGDQSKHGSIQHFQTNMDVSQEWMMPPTFVGSETSLRPRNGAEWPNFQMSDFTFGSDINMPAMNQNDFHGSMHGQGYLANGQYDHTQLNQLHNAAQTIQPSFAPGWPQNFQPQQVQHAQHAAQSSRPLMRFGSDTQFQPTGYIPPDGPYDHQGTPNMDWLEAHSSATNTQPNTEPNTQPSSPNWPKKRKLEDYQTDSRRMGFGSVSNGYPVHPQPTPPASKIPHQHKRSYTDQEMPPTPGIRRHMSFPQETEDVIDDEDAEFDEDQDHESGTRSGSPSSNAKSKTGKAAAKHARTRKKSTASSTPNKARSKLARNSVSSTSNARVPLSADQKKANHTNSEQRRRDATARAYAELYDLVPELEEMGKQSTMKKLEVVVSKVQRVKERVHQLRAALGLDVDTGTPLQHGSGRNQLNVGSARSMSGVPLDMASWS